MESFELTPALEDYVKVIWAASEWEERSCTIGELARQLGFAPSSVSETVKRMASLGLVDHQPYGGITLTSAGERAAVAMIRRHRIIETYLVRTFDYSWDEVHDEAERLEHAASDRLIDAMDAALGFPRADPHGDPIPRADGSIDDTEPSCNLTEVALDTPAVVVRVNDADAELLRWCAKMGIAPGAHIEVRDRLTGAQQLDVVVGGHNVAMSHTAAAAVWVAPLDKSK
ncbi:MAG: metal-dependent transcriptional regulator [Bowdeniella nasicola]|nr:metal-dependent transcriptional regulator [Bowdeniella nasicola]